jgi:hypothetical protein
LLLFCCVVVRDGSLDSQPQIAAHLEHRMERRSSESDGVVVVLFLSILQVGLWEKTKFVADGEGDGRPFAFYFFNCFNIYSV